MYNNIRYKKNLTLFNFTCMVCENVANEKQNHAVNKLTYTWIMNLPPLVMVK